MKAVALLASLRRRGLRFTLLDDWVHVAPRSLLTDDDRQRLRAVFDQLERVLRDEEAAIPDSPCGLWGSPLIWMNEWPTAGAHRWLCRTCCARHPDAGGRVRQPR